METTTININNPRVIDRNAAPTSLLEYVGNFLARGFKAVNAKECYEYGSVFSLILHRDPPWQAELFILRPNSGFPRDHRHPDVDSFEYGVSADCPIIVNGRPGVDLRRSRAAGGQLGGLYKVGAADWHRVGNIPAGGSFISLQQWKNAVAPTSVGLNWEGTPVSAEHRALLRQPGAKWLKTISKIKLEGNPIEP